MAAEVQGMNAASAGNEMCIVMDGDGQHDPDDIPVLLQSSADLVIGARTRRDDTAFRKLVSAGARWLARTGLNDPTSGFRVYSARAVRYLMQDPPRHVDYLGQIEIIKKFRRAGLAIDERPVKFLKRVGGKSHLSATTILHYALASVTDFA